jgi:hypothetical protein
MPKKTKKMKKRKKTKKKKVIDGYYIPGDGTIKVLYKEDR